ncbi:MAG: virulence RhuM family protein [Proteobacteria bacterium]|nr:virulence RhuM family protein [Pseudomonadota bacterium]
MAKKKEISIRSSASEYLTYISAIGDNSESVEVRYANENIWLTQKMMATIYNVEINTVNEHIKKIFNDGELEEDSTVRNFRIVQNEGSREVSRDIKHYNLQMIIAVGFKVNNEKAIQFRRWANSVVKDFTIQGWVMDEERLKNDGTILTKKYFEKQLQKIREIRMSERKFYQKITDIYATSLDYDAKSPTTKRFFATVQNKLHHSIHGHTAPELIIERASHKKENMGLSSWGNYPDGKIQKYDVAIAKNYLQEKEIKLLERLVSAYLDYADIQAERNIPMTMQDWEQKLNKFLEFMDYDVLQNAGKVTAEIAKTHAESEFEKYRIIQDRVYKSDFDKFLELEKSLKKDESNKND